MLVVLAAQILVIALLAVMIVFLVRHTRYHVRQDAMMKEHVADHERMDKSIGLIKRGVAHVLGIYGKSE